MNGQSVLVTGASGGIGAAIAKSFARAGGRVTLGCLSRPENVQNLCGRLAGEGCRVTWAAADVGSEAAADSLFKAAEAAFGPVEILVNNAGVAAQGLLCDTTLAQWEEMLRVHATGTFLCCRRALPSMIRRKSGCIINISSIWGQVGASCEAPYSAAKAAVIGLTRALAKEVGPCGIRVNCIAPGAIDTGMMDEVTDEARAALCGDTPLCRLGTAEEVASTALFLASSSAAFITGQVLGVNGGLAV